MWHLVEQAADQFSSDGFGALRLQHSSEFISMILREPDVPLNSPTSAWYIQQLGFELECLSDPQAPLGRLRARTLKR